MNKMAFKAIFSFLWYNTIVLKEKLLWEEYINPF